MSDLYRSNGMISTMMPDNGITAKSNMIFQEYLSNTAHQREMADAKAAGLNPWLLSHSGASVPAGATDSADILQLLNGTSAKSGSGSSEELDLQWADIFGALGMKKWQSQALGNVLAGIGVTVQDAVQWLATGAMKTADLIKLVRDVGPSWVKSWLPEEDHSGPSYDRSHRTPSRSRGHTIGKARIGAIYTGTSARPGMPPLKT